MSKLLVIDKSVFHKSIFHNGFAERLTEFVQNHRVVLPHALIVECIISDDEGGKKPSKNPADLLNRFIDIIKAGANIGLSPSVIMRKEKESMKAIGCIIDYQGCKVIRKSDIGFDRQRIKNEAQEARKAFKDKIDFCKTIAMQNYKNLIKKGYEKSFREDAEQTTPISRFEDWIQVSDKIKSDILKLQFPGLSKYITDNNDQWFSWQILRIIFAWPLEWAFKRNQSGSSFKGDIENDFYDMEYVACLCKADGILTNDKRLVIPLAQVAFPDKDVFSSLDKVSFGYRH